MVAPSINNRSSVAVNGRKLIGHNNRPDALASALKLNQKIYAIAFRAPKGSATKSKLNKIAKILNTQVEAALIRALGGGKIQEGRGGFFPDFYTAIESGEELKAVSTKEEDGKFVRTSAVKVAGGEGISLKRGTQELVTGFGAGGKAETAEFATTRFVNSLIRNKNDSRAILKLLDGKGQAAQAVKASLSAKTNFINIPVVFQGVTQNRRIEFTWPEIRKAVQKGGFRFSVKETDTGIKFQAYFTAGTITKALNDMDKVIVKELTSGQLGNILRDIVSSIMALPSKGGVKDLKQFLTESGFSQYAMEYIAGSAIISKGTIAIKKGKGQNRKKSQQFISTAQLTALVQKRLAQIMPRGPRRGPPLSDNILTERTGRFRKSVTAIPNYRKSMIRFIYDPIYKTFIDSPRNPDEFITRSIREVTQSLYGRQFAIVRGN
jgi:hypothetical protein